MTSKKLVSNKRAASVAGRAATSPRSLKQAALRRSASSRNPPVANARTAFGFFPPGLDGVVIHWPKL